MAESGTPANPPHPPFDKGGSASLIRPYRNGRDLTDKPRGVLLIDAFGLTETELRQRQPAIWQWLHDHVKPERDQNRDEKLRSHWWLHRRLREDLRKMLAGLPRYIATVETAKHRVFQFLDAAMAPDNMLVCIALDDAYCLGVLSSRVHVVWALAAGGTLEDRPRYNKTRCFEPFPFPVASPEQQARIRELAEEIDAHRKRVLAEHAGLSLTGLYNVLAALRAGHPLTTKEKLTHEQGLVAVLKALHDDLDAAVLTAYGWSDQPGDDTLLERLVALNQQRGKEETAGQVHRLRPAFQQPQDRPAGAGKPAMDVPEIAGKPAPPPAKLTWPADAPSRFGAVSQLLKKTQAPMTPKAIAACFSDKIQTKEIAKILATLEALSLIRQTQAGGYLAS